VKVAAFMPLHLAWPKQSRLIVDSSLFLFMFMLRPTKTKYEINKNDSMSWSSFISQRGGPKKKIRKKPTEKQTKTR